MKILKYFYAFLWLLIIPVNIGLSVENYLIRFYSLYDESLLAGLVVCVINSLVVTWIPGGFLINDTFNIREKHVFLSGTLLLLWVAGFVTPLLAGFRSFGGAVTVLMMISALVTMEEMRQISKRLRDREYDD